MEAELRRAPIRKRYKTRDGTIKEYLTTCKYKAYRTNIKYSPEEIEAIKNEIIQLYVDLEHNLGYSEVYYILSVTRPKLSLHMTMKWMKELEKAGLINYLR